MWLYRPPSAPSTYPPTYKHSWQNPFRLVTEGVNQNLKKKIIKSELEELLTNLINKSAWTSTVIGNLSLLLKGALSWSKFRKFNINITIAISAFFSFPNTNNVLRTRPLVLQTVPQFECWSFPHDQIQVKYF